MKKLLILVICGIFAISSTLSQDLFTENTENDGYLEINNSNTRFFRVTNDKIDTISVFGMLPEDGFSLICFSENWCKPSYKEFNKLYEDGIIDYLKKNNTRLIVLSTRYPFLNVEQLDSIAKNNIESDFEIYYNFNGYIAHSFPCIWLIDSHKRIIYHSQGFKDDYDPLKENIKTYLKHRCNRCRGTGRVKPNKQGGPDESVGLCSRCGGSGRR